MATDAEWRRIGADARAAGLAISEHVMRRLETGPPAADGSRAAGLPPLVLRRLAQAVLERLEWLRME